MAQRVSGAEEVGADQEVGRDKRDAVGFAGTGRVADAAGAHRPLGEARGTTTRRPGVTLGARRRVERNAGRTIDTHRHADVCARDQSGDIADATKGAVAVLGRVDGHRHQALGGETIGDEESLRPTTRQPMAEDDHRCAASRGEGGERAGAGGHCGVVCARGDDEHVDDLGCSLAGICEKGACLRVEHIEGGERGFENRADVGLVYARVDAVLGKRLGGAQRGHRAR